MSIQENFSVQLRHFIFNGIFVIDKNTQKVVCKIDYACLAESYRKRHHVNIEMSTCQQSIGIAYCRADDEFSAEIGKKIAFHRAVKNTIGTFAVASNKFLQEFRETYDNIEENYEKFCQHIYSEKRLSSEN